MITYFTQEDLISFGSYMVSEKRQERIKTSWEQDEANFPGKNCALDERLKEVYHADFENWKHENTEV